MKYKETAYVSLVRLVLEYSAPIWDPYLVKDISALEKVQRKAARYVLSDYGRTSSVTSMLDQLGWRNLAERRLDLHLTLLYKVVHGHINMPADSLGLTNSYSRTRANHKYKYQLPRAYTKELQYSCIHRTIPEWNALPASLAESDSVASFKSGLARLERSSE